MRINGVVLPLAVLLAWPAASATGRTAKYGPNRPLEAYIAEVSTQPAEGFSSSGGSLFIESGRLSNLAVDLRASQLNDLVTVVVLDKASAISRGSTKSSRGAEASASIKALGGPTRPAGPLSALASLSGERTLDGQGETSRTSEIQTTVSARVVHVLPNGNLIIEGSKTLAINSEQQRITIRGVMRWNDLSPSNRISSDRLANLEVFIEGKGVVGDAVRRPNFLYRLLLGLLPF